MNFLPRGLNAMNQNGCAFRDPGIDGGIGRMSISGSDKQAQWIVDKEVVAGEGVGGDWVARQRGRR
ncbi:hypothetical protein Bsp3421_003977 [Burkholderia sp. FERM BP-3421]|uniref:hypothetical protein n=1 Tax=Burkholderia sp. FERM BP-3421 TaxID=1494466 RepID=UPI0023620151|nr:hypothetical protein [Burkholderia sp. FERM BP-3421]WDD93876.1 hypothetical protein Bsp3421_003977 [Burkholderia sp. FERM BP-3421]